MLVSHKVPPVWSCFIKAGGGSSLRLSAMAPKRKTAPSNNEEAPTKRARPRVAKKAAPVAQPAASQSKPSEEAVAAVGQDPASTETVASEASRRLTRRDTDAQVDRIRTGRLKEVPESTFEGATDENGQSLRDYLAEHVRLNKKMKRKFSVKFWVSLFERFDLNSNVSDKLPDGPAGEEVRDLLLEKLAIVHHDNPAMRSTEPLERFLEECDELNRTELTGLIKGVEESPKVIRSANVKLVTAALIYMARTGVKTKHRELWDIMATSFDKTFAIHYEKMTATGIKLSTFVNKYMPVLSLFIGSDDLQVVVGASVKNEVPDLHTLQRVVTSSTIAKIMFTKLALKCNYLAFLKDVDSQVNNLEFHDYALNEVGSFKTVMRNSVKDLIAQGVQSWDRKESVVDFMTAKVKLTIADLNDDWVFRYAAKLKSTAINCKQLPLLPWEAALLPDGQVPGARQTIQISEELLRDHKNVRECALGYLGGRQLTFSDMRRTLSPHAKALLALDRTFDLELTFLTEHAEKLAVEMVRCNVLEACLPTEKDDMTPANSVVKLQQLRRTPLVASVGSNLAGEVAGILAIVKKLANKEGVTAEDANKYSNFYKTAMIQMERFFSVTKKMSTMEGNRLSNMAPIYGRKAIEYHITYCQQLIESGVTLTLGDVQPFRTYSWLLTPSQSDISKHWLSSILRNVQLFQPIADKPADAGNQSVPEASSASASSMGIVLNGGLHAGKAKARGTGKNDETTTTKADMLKFFAGRGKK